MGDRTWHAVAAVVVRAWCLGAEGGYYPGLMTVVTPIIIALAERYAHNIETNPDRAVDLIPRPQENGVWRHPLTTVWFCAANPGAGR